MVAVFIDRDGVINENLNGDYVKEWKEFKFLPGTLHSLKLLKTNKIKVIVVSNQSGVAKGLMTEEQLRRVSHSFIKEVKDNGGDIEAVYYCVHNVDESCDCRKPKPGLLLKASKELGIDIKDSYIIGDYISDIEAGVAAGVKKTILVRTGRGEEALLKRKDWVAEPDYIVSDLNEAVDIIINSKLKIQKSKLRNNTRRNK